ncbi:MAG: hypothetical protein LC126_15730, partial [Bryobacterales bacterium]|nr:hypothetical protein [Bryobacterales bacterium]
IWAPRVVAVPVRERLVWEDSERFARSEDWVDTTLRAGRSGNRLFLRVNGRAQVDFAEVRFRNGNVQVVDFRDYPRTRGTSDNAVGDARHAPVTESGSERDSEARGNNWSAD